MCKNKYDSYGTFELSDGAVLRHHDIQWIKELLSPFYMINIDEVIYNTMNGQCPMDFSAFVQNLDTAQSHMFLVTSSA